jgi:hypothetical protein
MAKMQQKNKRLVAENAALRKALRDESLSLGKLQERYDSQQGNLAASQVIASRYETLHKDLQERYSHAT